MPGCLNFFRSDPRKRKPVGGRATGAGLSDDAPDSRFPSSGLDDVPLRQQQSGLFVLYPASIPETVDTTEVDIVAVHGLNGNAWSTWTDQESGKMWLEDFLPAVIPNSRIMTFGYDAAIAYSRSVSGIEDFARDLLNRLRGMRLDRLKTRPIIFVCHSLGGIVVKKALILAHETGVYYAEILSSCRGIIFMGTPHRGADVASWALRVSQIANTVALLSLRTDLLKNLTYNSTILRDISTQFVHRAMGIQIRTFIEREFTLPLSGLVVQENSAVIGIPNELVFPVNADHRSMCRFSDATSQNYLLVERTVIELTTSCLDVVEQQRGSSNLAESLNSPHGIRPSPFLGFKIPVQLPVEKNQRFRGREKLLKRLHSTFDDRVQVSDIKRRTAVLHGLGGMGKSQISIEYVYRYSDFYTSIFWIDATSQATLSRSALAMVQQLVSHYKRIYTSCDIFQIEVMLGLSGCIGSSGCIDTKETPPERLFQVIRDWLSISGNSRWLIVLDNHDDIESVQRKQLVPTGNFGSVIITTRNSEAKHFGVGIEVEKIGKKAGISILLGVVENDMNPIEPQRITNHAEAEKIADKLGYLPLALEQAGGYISAMQIQLSEYLPKYDSTFKAIATASHPALSERYGYTFYTTWKTSFESLHPVGKQLLLLCAFLANQDVLEGLIDRGAKCLTWIDEVDKGLKSLFSFSLAKRLVNGRIFFHPLVLEVARKTLDSIEQKKYTKEALLVVAEAVAYRTTKTISDWAFEQEIAVHIDASIDNMWRYLSEIDQWDSGTPLAVSGIADVYKSQGKFEIAKKLLEEVVEYYGGIGSGEYDPCMQKSIHSMGSVYDSLGRYEEALEWYRQVLPTREKTLGKEHPETLRTIDDIAIVFYNQGKYEEALEWHTKALAGREKTLGGEHPDTITTTNNIANVFRGQGKYEKALEWHTKVLAGHEKTLGEEHPETLRTVNSLGINSWDQGKYGEALEWYGRALAGREKTLGKDHLDTITIVNNMAVVFWDQGKYDEALEWYGRALAVRQKALGKEHPDSLSTASNIAIVFHNQGKYEEALEWHTKVLAGREKTVGGGHPDTISTVNNIAVVLWNQGKYGEALEWYGRALAGYGKVVGEEHPDTLRIVDNMAIVFREQLRYNEALEWHTRALVGREKVLGKDHPDTLRTVNNMADVFRDWARYDEALKWYERALVGREKALGMEHPNTITTVNNIATVFRIQGKYREALEWYERALAGHEKVLGKEHPDTVKSARDLVKVRNELQ